jgi:hypothetical protein
MSRARASRSAMCAGLPMPPTFVNAFGDELLMQLQLNVNRLVVSIACRRSMRSIASTLAVRLERWRIGAEHAGWKFGWRDAPIALRTNIQSTHQMQTPYRETGSEVRYFGVLRAHNLILSRSFNQRQMRSHQGRGPRGRRQRAEQSRTTLLAA